MPLRVSYLPVLQILRELYVQPRDAQRFQRYVATLTGGSDDVVLPIGVANPMAREHALVKMDELLALGADALGAEAAATAARRGRLRGCSGECARTTDRPGRRAHRGNQRVLG